MNRFIQFLVIQLRIKTDNNYISVRFRELYTVAFQLSKECTCTNRIDLLPFVFFIEIKTVFISNIRTVVF